MQIIEHIAIPGIKLRAVEGQPFKFRMINKFSRRRIIDIVRSETVGCTHRIEQRQIRVAVHVHIARIDFPLARVRVFAREVNRLRLFAVHRHADIICGFVVFVWADFFGGHDHFMAVCLKIQRFPVAFRSCRRAVKRKRSTQCANRSFLHRLSFFRFGLRPFYGFHFIND